MSIKYVKKGQIAKDIKKAHIKKILQNSINALPDHRSRKNDISLLEFVCNILEEKVKKKYNINKLDLLFEVFESVFDKLSATEKESIEKNVKYLLESNSIKKIKSSVKIFEFVKNFLKKKSI